MKRLNVLVLAGILFGISSSWAQDNTDEVTDEELRKYAVAMDSINTMRSALMATITEMVKNNEKLSAARYNELSKIIADEEKLTAANATPEEIEAVKLIIQAKDEGTAEIQATFQTLAKEYVGAAVYNKVKKALASDPEVKARYDSILAEISKDMAD